MVNYHADLEKSLNEIGLLVKTPSLMQEIILDSLNSFEKSNFNELQRQKFANLIQTIENISEQSLKQSFQIIYNQTCVLSVSSLGAVLEKYFINYATSNWKNHRTNPAKIKLSLEDLGEYNLNVNSALGKIIKDKDNSINFQDLQSTKRAFKDYFHKDIEIDFDTMSKVVFYQQCRHLIVHREGIIDSLFLNRVADFNLKNFKEGDVVILDKEDWVNIQSSFKSLVEIVIPKNNLFESESGKIYQLEKEFN